MSSKATGPRLTIRLTDDLDAWLGIEADKRALDKASFARMLIAERKSAVTTSVAPVPSPMPFHVEQPAIMHAAPPSPASQMSPVVMHPVDQEFPDEPRAEEMDIPADPDGGEPSAALAALMREAEARRNAAPAQPIPTPYVNGERLRPGALTRPPQQWQGLGQGSQMGDAAGNIVRENFRHLSKLR